MFSHEMDRIWKKEMHAAELHNLYSTTNIIYDDQIKDIGRAYSMHGRDEKCIQNFRWKSVKTTWEPRCTWENNIKMDLK
jgi:hypothetical protein